MAPITQTHNVLHTLRGVRWAHSGRHWAVQSVLLEVIWDGWWYFSWSNIDPTSKCASFSHRWLLLHRYDSLLTQHYNLHWAALVVVVSTRYEPTHTSCTHHSCIECPVFHRLRSIERSLLNGQYFKHCPMTICPRVVSPMPRLCYARLDLKSLFEQIALLIVQSSTKTSYN